MKRFVRNALFLLISGGLLVYVLKDVALASIIAQFRQAYPGRLLVVAVIILLISLVRAVRWQMALRGLGYFPALSNVLVAMLAGNLASLIIPGAGELTRCGTLERTNGVPLAQGIGSVVAERIVDLLMLVLTIILTLIISFQRLKNYAAEVVTLRIQTLPSQGYIWLGLIIGSLLAWWLSRWLQRTNAPFINRIKNVLQGLWQGFLSIRQLPSPAGYLALSILSYMLTWSVTYFAFFTTPLTAYLTPEIALSIMTASLLGGLAVPTQGGVGTYHALTRMILVLYGYSATAGSLIATYLHAVIVGFSLLWAVIGFIWATLLLNRQANKLTSSTDAKPKVIH